MERNVETVHAAVDGSLVNAQQLPGCQIQRLLDAFRAIDLDHSGTLDRQELVEVLRWDLVCVAAHCQQARNIAVTFDGFDVDRATVKLFSKLNTIFFWIR